VQEVEQTYHMPVISIATLDDLVEYLQMDGKMSGQLEAVNQYRRQFGVAAHA